MKIYETAVPVVHLSEVVDAATLAEAVADGMVRVQSRGRLRIFNYTEQAVYSRTWNAATTACRGLIADADDVVLARPWPKFFNHGELAGSVLDLQAPVEVTDKADGSLGILYRSEGPAADWAVATRGSFTSEQAQHASALYQERYADAWEPIPGWTYLFEIIYPANRIVLNYGGTDDLVLLGAVQIATGVTAGPDHDVCSAWPGPKTQVQNHRTLAEALAAPPRPNAEGLVVRYLSGESAGLMLKLKQADYVVLHRIVTGLTSRRLWERSAVHAVFAADPDVPPRRLGQVLHLDVAPVQAILEAGPQWLEQVRQSVPEEFLDWITETMMLQQQQVSDIMAAVDVTVAQLAGVPRKEVAARIGADPNRAMIFAALDHRSILAQAWAAVRPSADRPFAARGEDVA